MKEEPTDAEVNAAIDLLRDHALRSIIGITGHDWGRREQVKEQVKRAADLLKRALADPKVTP